MSDFSFSSTAEDVTEGISLAGKTIAITGVGSGLGQESARVLAKRGAFIVGAARTKEKAEEALRAVGAEGVGVACDLSEPSSVRASVDVIRGLGRKLDVILCNAGIMALPERQQKQGVELQFLTNHMGHFLFATGLQDLLTDDGRVVVVSSGAHRMAPEEGIRLDDLGAERAYDAWQMYGQSKLANILFARSLHKRFEGTNQVAVSLHPGVIRTNLGRYDQGSVSAMLDSMDPSSIKTIPQGAATQCLLAARPEGASAGGQYWADCQPSKTTPPGRDDELAEKLWQASEALAARLT